ncbi:MAG TPA: cyclase family protein [Polyangiaceae bacterium LLY-WYZ-15_(1-7)]|mgnify:CR=1 FL=1|nr:arylformamidase [Sandaracinus sp.]HJL03464.1 cyclase family protein [Polyangiaceae bacterium LLY-WYZ-15_(1-7)]MBJ74972.1 arylformamidase [Sandaracinus sp.]HJL09579.1 cyclase family protein [Polyangiaceae bacterium LLY-WYZ-15_(1-7)]HJL25940.1 cyclase family protein [Polyangiaceae bacterium LLY-WYZ-15_(1-7)]
MSDWIDVSVPIHADMPVWPGNPGVEVERTEAIACGAVANVSRLYLGVHTGTHMDAPVHFLEGTPAMDAMPLDATLGLARVVEVEDPVAIRAEAVRELDPQPGERLLFKTRNSSRDWAREPFDEGFVYIDRHAAALLAEAGVRTVGVDYLSVGGFHADGVETHHALLKAGIWIIEGLDLSAVSAGRWELACLPLKLVGADGAPARAALRRWPGTA